MNPDTRKDLIKRLQKLMDLVYSKKGKVSIIRGGSAMTMMIRNGDDVCSLNFWNDEELFGKGRDEKESG